MESRNISGLQFHSALYGVVAKKDGTVIDIAVMMMKTIQFSFSYRPSRSPSSQQMTKKANVVIEGEALDVLLGSKPLDAGDSDDKEATKDRVKAGIPTLKEKYNFEEDDFPSEIEVVPAGKARDLGLIELWSATTMTVFAHTHRLLQSDSKLGQNISLHPFR